MNQIKVSCQGRWVDQEAGRRGRRGVLGLEQKGRRQKGSQGPHLGAEADRGRV